jgi:hypothetical protein
MKKIAVALFAVLSAATPALANPFRYETTCYLDLPDAIQKVDENCVVIETREKGGALKTRNIFSNRLGLTIKMRWVGDKFLTSDSFNKFEYHWIYKPNPNIEKNGVTATYVMPGVSTFVSWD